jgi:hypothetical protein
MILEIGGMGNSLSSDLADRVGLVAFDDDAEVAVEEAVDVGSDAELDLAGNANAEGKSGAAIGMVGAELWAGFAFAIGLCDANMLGR